MSPCISDAMPDMLPYAHERNAAFVRGSQQREILLTSPAAACQLPMKGLMCAVKYSRPSIYSLPVVAHALRAIATGRVI